MLQLRYVCIGLVVLVSGSQALAQESPLVWKFSVGDEHRYRLSQQMDMEMTLGATGRKLATTVEQVVDFTWTIDQVDDEGQATILQTVDRLQMDIAAPGKQEMHFDSDSDEAPTGFGAMLAPLAKAMTDQSARLTMTPRGEITSCELSEALAKAMETIPGANMMGEMLTPEGFKNAIQRNSPTLPAAESLEQGQEWSETSEIANAQLGKTTTVTTYRYLGPRDALEALQFEVKTSFGAGPGGVQAEVVNEASDGEILFDGPVGRLESNKLHHEVELRISAPGQELTQKMVKTTNFTRIDDQTEQP